MFSVVAVSVVASEAHRCQEVSFIHHLLQLLNDSSTKILESVPQAGNLSFGCLVSCELRVWHFAARMVGYQCTSDRQRAVWILDGTARFNPMFCFFADYLCCCNEPSGCQIWLQ